MCNFMVPLQLLGDQHHCAQIRADMAGCTGGPQFRSKGMFPHIGGNFVTLRRRGMGDLSTFLFTLSNEAIQMITSDQLNELLERLDALRRYL